MLRRHFAYLLLVLTCLLVPGSAALAQQEMEIIPLRSRTVSEVLPSLLPLVEPGGTLTGMNDQLFLRASPRNRSEIKRALAAIDKPRRNLIIRVALNRQAEDSNRGAAGQGQVTLGTHSRVEADARVWDTRSARSEGASQIVQTIEGGRAFIQVGRSLPIPLQQVVIGPGGAVVNNGVVFRDLGQGFYASPRLSGERVTLEITQQSDSPGQYGYGSVDRQQLSTTVSGRLGEWIELGGSGRQAAGRESGSYSVSTGDVRDNRSIWLKVEEAP